MEIREKCHSGRVWPEAFVRWRRRRDDTRCDSCLDDELTIRHIVIRLLKVSRLVFPIGRVTLTIALPAVAYIRGPSPSPIHEESTLFPTGLRSPILSSLLPFFSFLSFFLSFFLPPLLFPCLTYREFDDRLASGLRLHHEPLRSFSSAIEI